MILKLEINKEDLLQIAKFRGYKPSSVDLTKEEMATELAAEILKAEAENAWLKEDRQAVTKRNVVISAVQ